MPHPRTHLVAVAALVAAMTAGTAVAGESPSVPKRVGHAVEKAAEATEHGLKRGVEATSHGVQVGVKATEHGLSRAGKAVEHATRKTADKLRSTLDK